VGGHGPFRGLDAPLALQTLYHELQCPRELLVLGTAPQLSAAALPGLVENEVAIQTSAFHIVPITDVGALAE
jgi:hypothetical protein